MGTYSIDSVTRYINFYEIIKQRNAKYPFAVFNTDKAYEKGFQCVDIHPKNQFIFV